MKLSDILKSDPTEHDFSADYDIVKLDADVADFQIYYVCELGGLLFDHAHAGVIYTEVLETSSALSAQDIEKIQACLRPEILCSHCGKLGSDLCKPPVPEMFS